MLTQGDSRRKKEMVLKPAVLKLWGLPECQNIRVGISVFLTDVSPMLRSAQNVADTEWTFIEWLNPQVI